MGTGGDRMKLQGVDLIAELDDLTVMGFVEVLPRIPYFWRLERRIHRLMDGEKPDLVVLIDFPGFNMRIARAAHERGCAVLYYIAPKAQRRGDDGRAGSLKQPLQSGFLKATISRLCNRASSFH